MKTSANGLQERSVGSRYVALDGMRGIAAAIVVFYHFAIMFALPNRWYLRPFVTGEAAVLLFFTLSGFVLSLPYWNKGTVGPYNTYLMRRFFRIVVPLTFARIVALVGDYFFGRGNLPLSPWYYLTWQDPITVRFVVRELVFDTGPRLNTAFWSLRYEIVVSLAFPILLALLGKLKLSRSTWLIAILYVLGADLLPYAAQDVQLYHETVRYGAMFLLGAVIAQQRQQLRMICDRLHVGTKIAVLLCSMACYGDAGKYLLPKSSIAYLREPFIVLGAAGLIIMGLYFVEFRKALETALPVYLGRISYSLYLIHGTVLFALTNLLYWKSPPWVIFFLYLSFSFSFAHLFCVTIEEPFLRLGKRFADAASAMPWTFNHWNTSHGLLRRTQHPKGSRHR
jgi:peptidoglycan/LPS O-acetylase OafA/YrhL